MTAATILWRRLDRPGHESSRVHDTATGYRLEGAAVTTEERQPCRLDYSIELDGSWRTRSVRVNGWIGNRLVALQAEVDSGQRWVVNEAPFSEVDGCMDVDLSFSPATNLLPIRRLGLQVGQRAPVRAAWIQFPSCAVEPLEQVYERVAEFTYRYTSAGGRFVALLEANAAGFVTSYPGFWEAVAG